MTSKPLLYSFWRSSCAWRVRIALNLKEIPYDIKPIDLLKNIEEKQPSTDLLSVNPMGKVPALHIDGHVLIESMNILYYLEETRPLIKLVPNDVIKRSRMREICESILSGVQPFQNVSVLRMVGEDKASAWAQHWIILGFQGIEKLLKKSSGKYCIGEEITLADCFLIPQVFNARRFEVDVTQFPTIEKIDRELKKHPAFEAAHPFLQPDCRDKSVS